VTLRADPATLPPGAAGAAFRPATSR